MVGKQVVVGGRVVVVGAAGGAVEGRGGGTAEVCTGSGGWGVEMK